MQGRCVGFDKICKNENSIRVLWRVVLLCALAVLLSPVPLFASPSVVCYEGSHAIWKIGDVSVWRFPKANAPNVVAMSDRFNVLYKRGFALKDLRVTKIGNEWSLCIGENILGAASPKYCVAGKRGAKEIALTWMSRMYDAAGNRYGQELTPKYKIKGAYDINSKVSWYGGKFIGKKFANGERFTECHLTAAAKSLPFGTLVKVTTPSTGKSVVVRVTDRFREHKGRALDISQAAAEVLGIKNMGVAGAKIQVIGRVESVGGK